MSRVSRVDSNQDSTLLTPFKEGQSAMRAMTVENKQPPVSLGLV